MKKENEPVDATATKLDAIKNIIFGQDIAQIQKEFNSVKDTLGKLRQKSEADDKALLDSLSQRLKEIEMSINGRLDKLEKEVYKKLDSLSEDKVDSNKLSQLFEKISQNLKR